MNVVNQFRRLLKTEALLTIAAIATIAKAIEVVTEVIILLPLNSTFVILFVLFFMWTSLGPVFFF